MSKAKTLATTVSTGNVLADGTVAYAEVSGTPTLATVATSGSYTDLTNKPTITDTATNIAGGSNGTIPYQTAADTTAMLAVGTAGQVLQTNGAGAPSWATISANPTVVRSARTSNTILGAADQSTLIDITSGTFSQTFTAASTLGSGWFCYIRNSGTGDITLDPNGSETIDGLTSYIMYPGETRLVQCDGTGFNSIVIKGFYTTFIASGTFVKPPGYSQFSGLLWGGGGGGAKDGSSTYAGGGGGGNCLPFTVVESTFSSSQTVIIGAGGAASGGSGADGGNSSVGSVVVSYGGAGALSGGNPGSGGGALSAGSPYEPGKPYLSNSVRSNTGYGGGATEYDAAWGGAGGALSAKGGDSIWGGGGGSGAQGNRVGGSSIYGGNGGSGSAYGTAGAGAAPAGGGGGSWTGTSGAGGRGELRIWGIV